MNRIPFFAFLLTTALTISCPEMVMAQSSSSARNDGSSARATRTAPRVQDAAQDNDGWIDVLPGGAAARIRMPVEPRYVERTMTPDETSEITLHSFLSTVRDGNLSYMFSHFEMLDSPVGEKETALRYDQAVRGQVLRVQGEVDSYSRVEMGPHIGREFVYRFSDDRGNDFKAQVRLFIRLGVLYEVKVIALEKHFSEKGAAKFFESFRFSRKKNPMPEPAEEAAEQPAQ